MGPGMPRFRPILLCFTALTLLLLAGTARAQEGGSSGLEPAPRVAPRMDLSLLVGAGILVTPDAPGVYADVAATYRIGLLELGAFGQLGGEVFGYSFTGAGATAGVAWRAPFGLRLSLAGAFGAHGYKGVGSKFLDADPGGDGETLFVGARAGVSWISGKGPTHFEIGIAAAAEADVIRDEDTYSYFDVEETRRVRRTIGGAHATLSLLRLGVSSDVL
jgi:hypothetical protein